jgi:hypothetical protein
MALEAVAEEPAALSGTFAIPFKKDLLKVHPRLLYSKDDMASWPKTTRTDQKFIWDVGAGYFKVCESPIDTKGEPWNQGDGWQKFGWWRGVTTVQLYAKTGEKKYADNAIALMMAMCASEHWELGGEQDYGMGTGNIMATVAIIYDTTYDLLTDAQRATVRKRLWLAADRFYNYGFHEFKKLPKPDVRYWENDPQNNHRWHRLCGYMLGCLAIYGEEPGIDGYLDDAIKEANFVQKWLPEDGSCHESAAYQAFGTQFLVPTFVAMDRCLGNDAIRKHPFFHEAPYFRAHMVTPNGLNMWSFGDGDAGTYYFAHYNFKLAAEWRDEIAQALHLRNFALSEDSYSYHGFSLIWHDPSLKAGDLSKLATSRYFPDMEIATFRQSWTDPKALAAFFKCSPYGGHQLNAYRDSFNPPHYVNVAHDHPDAGEFLLAWDGQLFAMETSEDKQTRHHNTIMVNGKGQEGEGDAYTQPIPNMGTRAKIEQYFGAAGYGMARGEAGKYYKDLSRFARTFLYVDDAYLLAIDEIKAPKPASVDWLYHCDGQWTEAGKAAWTIAKGPSKVRVSIAYPEDITAKTAPEGKMTTLTASKNGADLRMVMLVAPQSANPAEIVQCKPTPGGFVLQVKRGDMTDWIAVGPCDTPEIKSDGEVGCITTKGAKVVKMMLIKGKGIEGGKASLRFDQAVNALADSASGKLTISAPLRDKAGQTSMTATEVSVKSANGQPLAGAPAGSAVKVTLPTWKEKQDALN